MLELLYQFIQLLKPICKWSYVLKVAMEIAKNVEIMYPINPTEVILLQDNLTFSIV